MPTITFSLKDLQHLVGRKLTIGEVEEFAYNAKGSLESHGLEFLRSVKII